MKRLFFCERFVTDAASIGDRRWQRRFRSRLAALLAVAAACSVARADVFVLHSGGRIEGEWRNADERPPKNYLIETERGGRITIEKSQLKEIIHPRPAEAEYEQIAPNFRDDVQDQWKLAQWCREHSLGKLREVHLRRILELDPDCVPAWHGLGYSQVAGRWMRGPDLMREHGLEFYRGRWRFVQEIEVMEERAKYELLQKEWTSRLKRWRQNLVQGNKAQEVQDELLHIRDEHAVRPLAQMLATEPTRSLRLLYVDALANIATFTAHQALVHATLHNADIEVMHACVDRLVEHPPRGIVDLFVDHLKDANNDCVNRAAFALGRLQDKGAIVALIDSLVTTHKLILPAQGSTDAVTATFTKDGASDGGLGLPMISKPRGASVIFVRKANTEVLTALTKLAGANLGFDQPAWRSWLAGQNQSATRIEPRRDGNR